jgi:hypothetical protein
VKSEKINVTLAYGVLRGGVKIKGGVKLSIIYYGTSVCNIQNNIPLQQIARNVSPRSFLERHVRYKNPLCTVLVQREMEKVKRRKLRGDTFCAICCTVYNRKFHTFIDFHTPTVTLLYLHYWYCCFIFFPHTPPDTSFSTPLCVKLSVTYGTCFDTHYSFSCF